MDFNNLYADLAIAWTTHQDLRSSGAEIHDLVAASERLDVARAAMRNWLLVWGS